MTINGVGGTINGRRSGGSATVVPKSLFQNAFSDTFNRANTSFGGAGTNTGGGNGWIDVNGNVAKIVSNKLSLTGDASGVNQYLRDYVVRPNTELHTYGRMEVDSDASTWNSSALLQFEVAYQSATKNHYMFAVAGDGSATTIYIITGGAVGSSFAGTAIANFSAAKTYRIRCERYASKLSLTIYDVTGGQTPVAVGSCAATDTTITAAGVFGIGAQWNVASQTHLVYNVNISWKSNMPMGAIGDSIAASIQTGMPYTPAEMWARSISTKTGKSYTMSNQAIGGTDTSVWAPASANLVAAKAAFATAGVTDVFIELGANDAITTTLLAASTYSTRMAAICADLVGAGYRVHLVGCIYTMMSVGNNRDYRTNVLLQAYNLALQALANGTTIFLSDMKGFDWFAANQYRFVDTIHPDKWGSEEFADLIANASAQYF